MTVNVAGQVGQIRLSTAKALWPLFETIINSIQSLEDSCIDDKEIVINALRQEETQLVSDEHGNVNDEPARFESFTVTDNGNGFNKRNYTSFLEAYSQLKVTKGCKGIGRFLWLKAFDNVDIKSTYLEEEQWHCRTFKFSVNGIAPEQNDLIIAQNTAACETIVSLNGFKVQYRDAVAYSLESLAEYVIRRKAVIDLLERALEADDKGRYSKESSIHRIICPMQTTSNEIKFDDMNLWLIDDRLSYQHFWHLIILRRSMTT